MIRGRGTWLLVLVALGCVVMPRAALAGAPGNGGCTAPVATHIAATTGRVVGGQAIGFTIVGRAGSESCPPQSLSISLPRQLAPVRQTGAVIDALGHHIGRVTSHRSSRVVVTLHRRPAGGAFAGAFAARLRYSVPPDTPLRLRWRSGRTVVDTSELRTARCGHCRIPRTKATGRALLDGNQVQVTLESTRSRTPGERVRFGVHLGKSLRVRCAHAGTAHLGRNGLGQWGELRTAGRLPLHDLRCDRDHAVFNRGGTRITGWVRVPRARRYAIISVPAQVRDHEANTFPVWGTIGQRHTRTGVAVTARRYTALLQPSPDLVPAVAKTHATAASPRAHPRPVPEPTSSPDQDERGPVIATTVAILAAGLAVLVFRIRRRSS